MSSMGLICGNEMNRPEGRMSATYSRAAHECPHGSTDMLRLPGLRYTVKCCFTISALNSSFLPAAITAPLAITT